MQQRNTPINGHTPQYQHPRIRFSILTLLLIISTISPSDAFTFTNTKPSSYSHAVVLARHPYPSKRNIIFHAGNGIHPYSLLYHNQREQNILFFNSKNDGNEDSSMKNRNSEIITETTAELSNIENNNSNDDIYFTEEELSDDIFESLEENAPPPLFILKELLGINIFTYILAGLIAIMLSLNVILGPGWLGQKMGIPGTGTFTEMSKSLPGTYDLNESDNLF